MWAPGGKQPPTQFTNAFLTSAASSSKQIPRAAPGHRTMAAPQRHLVLLAHMRKEILDFDMHVNGESPVKKIVSGKTWHRPLGGYNAVVNVGLDENWLAHPLAMANLYAYGRLAWNPDLSAEETVGDWTRLTFGNKPQVVETISKMLLSSWHIYESYTGPLGAGTLTDILGDHYGPGIESSEHN